MRTLLSAFALLVLLLSSQSAWADYAASVPILVRPSSQRNETRDYRVTVVTTGNMPNPDGKGLIDATHTAKLKIRLKFQARDKDGLLPLTISLVEGELQLGDQRMMTGPDFYPPITALLNRDYQIQSLIGLAGTRFEDPKPGISYANLIMLFMLPEGLASRSLGDTWKTTFKLPGWNLPYEFTNKIESVEKIGDVDCFLLAQSIRARYSTAAEKWWTTANVRTAFSLANGALLKSHVDCEVIFGEPGADKPETTASATSNSTARAEIKIDIISAK